MKLKLNPQLNYYFLILLFFTISGILFQSQALAQQKPADEYQAMVKSADNYFAAKDYANALSTYKNALQMKPGQQSVMDRVEQIRKLLSADETAKNQLFEDAILKAETFFKSKDYPAAKHEFEKALDIDPSAEYPRDRLEQIRSLYSDPNDASRYAEAMGNGNKELALANYENARNWFQIASAVKPDSRPAKDKLLETDRLQKEATGKKAEYDNLTTAADALLKTGKRDEAKAQYRKAADLLPAEPYAPGKIQEIDSWLNAKNNLQEAYDKAIDQADKYYVSRDFDNAKIKYEEALKLKPEARYPKEMLTKTSQNATTYKSAKEKFDAMVAAADKSRQAGDLSSALSGYRTALSLDPEATYLEKNIKDTEKAIADKASLEDAYASDIQNGDQALKEEKYDPALGYYRNASTLKPYESYPKDKITEINRILDQFKQLESSYQLAISEGDQKLKLKNFQEALAAFESALKIKPGQKYPQDKIMEIQSTLDAQKSQEEKFASAVAGGDQSLKDLKYNEALVFYKTASGIKPGEKYPADKITEINGILARQKAELENYEKAIAAADKAFKEKDLKTAIGQYQAASVIKPAEQYPADQIASINRILEEGKALKERYAQSVAAADKLLLGKEYEKAITAYQETKNIIPEEKYPDQKIAEINALLASARSANENYSHFISEADTAIAGKKYTQALAAYQSSLKIKPGETYPKDQIALITKLEEDQKKLNLDYQKAISAADKSLTAKNFPDALAAYKEALTLKAEEKYPKDKISEINSLLADQKNREESYSAAISAGDQAFSAKQYPLALKAYEDAAGFKTSEKYPKDRIAEINTLLASEKARQAGYAAAVAKADASMADKQYSLAISGYRQASAVDSTQPYPKQKIQEINTLLEQIRATEEAYGRKITEADNLFDAKNYSEAITAYNQALRLKNDEKYPIGRIAQINAILDGFKATEEKYAKNISEADAFLARKNYSEALGSYKSALSVKTAEKYPQEKITEIDGILADLKSRDDSFSASITEADQLFESRKYPEAIQAYQKALAVKPEEKYPSSKITEAEKILAEIKAKQSEYDKSIAEGDQQLASGKYAEALAAYSAASVAKPAEEYPKQKTEAIRTILAELKSRDDSYTKAITDGDAFYSAKKYQEALEPYQKAVLIKKDESYPKEQITKINQFISEQKNLDETYKNQLADAEKLLSAKKYQPALTAFQEASRLKPAEQYPLDKIQSVQATLLQIQANDEAYNKALSEADSRLASGELALSMTSYNKASQLKPEESYPKEKTAEIQARIKAIDDRYNKALSEGDTKLSAKNYADALNAYQQAIEIKPEQKYPKEQIDLINASLVREKEEQEKMYTAYNAEGDKLLAALDYVGAKSAFVKASGLKPAEQYPKDKLQEINKVLEERALVVKEAYDKAVVEADKLYANKVLDQAIDAYDKAALLKPDETYPGEMVRKIKQYITDHSIKDINTGMVLIAAGDEKKFSFTSLEPRQKTNNYIMIRARATGNIVPKVYFNYGRDNTKNGGIVLRTISSRDGVDYLIRLTGQDKWYREDNNWVSIYTEGSGVEISRIQVSQGD